MIYIYLSEEKRDAIESIYWKWFTRYHLKEFEKILNEDKVLKKIFDFLFGKDVIISEQNWKNFLFSDYEQLKKIKENLKGVENRKVKGAYEKKYTSFRRTQAWKIVNELEIDVCPYCNQNYIKIFQYNNKKVSFQGDIDHFFPKSKYPQLAFCLYNMIPSCKVCNHLKGDQEDKINYPYITERVVDINSNIQFCTTFDEKCDISYLNGNSLFFNIEIKDEEKLSEEEKNEVEKVFKLNTRYNILKEEARDTIIKVQAYHDKYLQNLKCNWSKIVISEEELKEVLFGYSREHHKKPLSKFHFDIMKEFEELE